MRIAVSILVIGFVAGLAARADAQVDHRFYPLSIDLNSVAFLDRASIQGQKPDLEAWIMFVYSPPMKGVEHRLSKVAFGCNAGTMRFIYSVSYDEKGQAVGGPRAGGTATPVVPGTIGETLLHDACAIKRADDRKNEHHTVNAAIDFAKGAMGFLQKLPKLPPKK